MQGICAKAHTRGTPEGEGKLHSYQRGADFTASRAKERWRINIDYRRGSLAALLYTRDEIRVYMYAREMRLADCAQSRRAALRMTRQKRNFESEPPYIPGIERGAIYG